MTPIVKQLHMSKSLDELQARAAIIWLDIDKTSAKLILKNTDKLYTAGKKEESNGDEERAFYYYFRFLEAMSAAQKKADFEKHKENLLAWQRFAEVLGKVKSLTESLQKRYALQKELEASRSAVNTKKTPLNVTKKEPKAAPGKKPFVLPLQYRTEDDDDADTRGNVHPSDLKYLLDKKKKVLLVDCRDQADFSNNHINHSNSICVPASALQKGMSVDMILNVLRDVQPNSCTDWRNRGTFEFIILYDWNSSISQRSQPLNIVYEALVKWDGDAKKNRIFVLYGGISLMFHAQPALLTNPSWGKSVPKATASDLYDLKRLYTNTSLPEPELRDLPLINMDVVKLRRGNTYSAVSSDISKSTRSTPKSFEEPEVKAQANSHAQDAAKSMKDEDEKEKFRQIIERKKAETTRLKLDYDAVLQELKENQTSPKTRPLVQEEEMSPKELEQQKLAELVEAMNNLRVGFPDGDNIILRPAPASIVGDPVQQANVTSTSTLPRGSLSPVLAPPLPPIIKCSQPQEHKVAPIPTRVFKTGLENLGNTCFMNSIMQCLSHTSALVDYLLSGDHLNEWHPERCFTKGEVTDELAVAFHQIREGHRPIVLDEFKATIEKYQPRFKGSQQQDAHEFLTIILDWLHEEMNRVPIKFRLKEQFNDGLSEKMASIKAMREYKRSYDSIISDLFCGQQKSLMTCGHCEKQSVTFEPFFILSVPIPPRAKTFDIRDCFDLYMTEEVIFDWKCSNCDEERCALKKIDLWRLPPYLIIHFQRFRVASNGTCKKRSAAINFPIDHLNVDHKVLGRQGDEISPNYDYELYGVSNHFGGIDSGHYTAYCRTPGSKDWWKFNDVDASPIEAQEVSTATRSAYILFYHNRNANI